MCRSFQSIIAAKLMNFPSLCFGLVDFGQKENRIMFDIVYIYSLLLHVLYQIYQFFVVVILVYMEKNNLLGLVNCHGEANMSDFPS